ncbi:hypothetical protein IFM61606_02013 [Aspergillus udagawae]|uniref:DUF7719 domain-containing protein n=1 Tax=Aspergillus udagawae TaxID=91492 RepID=A0A8H3P9B7_9EURO|nr:uncharacterized protein Aud_005636 [Aspergillus udagawae]GFF47534.1 hypothetical protein IFM51744_06594 [Aspergillus udagawae]GFF71036.1 hypothetical protein IFM53868_00456 [Aspergillus udagawae]GFG19106.1 hypothetical protein IFM5058_09712 [Aspergillus udagawae]GFG22158.1 hypothetical protein IFM61606_02013 [Aspergillus udagawae]GIC89229.1 hypothetical protein Aud_005636 [Aspergillus udagawae]
MEGPRNRKQRRAAAGTAAASTRDSSFDPSSIPLAHPQETSPDDVPKRRTLVELIAERQNEILAKEQRDTAKSGPETQFMTVDPLSGKISQFNPSMLSSKEQSDEKDRAGPATEGSQIEPNAADDGVDEPIPPLIDTLLLSVPLTTLHLTLAYLAAHQYAETIVLEKLLRESAFIAFPMLTLLVHLAHGHVVSVHRGNKKQEKISLFPWSQDKLTLSFVRKLLFPPSLRTMAFLPVAVLLGTKLMTMTNEDPYYAVMKQAPAIGTLWVWSILEIPVGAAALGALGPLIWGVWWKGYGIF